MNPLKPDLHVECAVSPAPLPKAEDFVGIPLTVETLHRAQAAVNELRAHARQYKEYVSFFEDGREVFAYYGVSGEALHNAVEICRHINRNVSLYAPHLSKHMVHL